MTLLLALLRVVSLLLPQEVRAEWLREWSAECWHCWQEPGGWRAVEFCWGAIPDALWMRRNSLPSARVGWLPFPSPWDCGLFLAGMAGMAVCLVWAFPGPPKQAMAPERLVMLSPQRYFGAQLPTVTLEQYQEWARANGAFAKMAFYRPVVMRAGGSAIRVGRVSGDLFGLLGARVPAGAELVVRDGKYAGVVLEVGGRKVRAAAVLPRSAWQLPGKIDAWLLTGEPTTGSKGFVVGELRKGGLPAPVEGGEDPVYCQKLSDVAVTSGVGFAMVVGLSCLLLPVTTRLSLGEYSGTRLRQRGFLAVKFGFVLLITFCATRFMANQVLAWGWIEPLLLCCLLGLRWVLIDQRGRCPVCLRLVSHPVKVGQSSRNFLAWSGTEFMCGRGHGLLHVPEFPTSWFSTQRWLYLDASWSGLFR